MKNKITENGNYIKTYVSLVSIKNKLLTL